MNRLQPSVSYFKIKTMQVQEGCNWTNNEENVEVKFYMKNKSDRVGGWGEQMHTT